VDLKETELLGDAQDTHWYFVSKALALRRAAGDRPIRRVLDVGAGSGFFSRVLLRETSAESAVCVDTGYASERSERYLGKSIAFTKAAPDLDADLVLMMDVLEHVDDDIGLVREYVARARPGTRFVVSVPAFSWLWSGHDVFLEHRRRYTLASVGAVLSGAGLSPVGAFYFFGAVFPAAVAQRLWSRRSASRGGPHSQLRRHHPLTNALLIRICLAESAVATHNRLFGLTAFAVADKPGGNQANPQQR
jgi:SAM-dependent methyltransferase